MSESYVAVTNIGSGYPIWAHVCDRTGYAVVSDGSFGPSYSAQHAMVGIASERIGLGQVVEIDGGRGSVASVVSPGVGMTFARGVASIAITMRSAMPSCSSPAPDAADALIADAVRSAGPEPEPKYQPDRPADFDPDHLWKITTGGTA